jgi:hypothetical protein
MDKIRVLFAVGIAAWFALKLYGLGTWTWEQSNQAGILWNLACVTSVAALLGYVHREQNDFLVRWKNVAKTTVLYSFLLSCSMGIWYYGLVPETIEQRKTEQLELLEQFVNNPAALEDVQRTNTTLGRQSADDIYAQQAANLEVFFSPVFFIGTVLMVWIFTAAALAAIFTAVMPKIWNAQQG